MKSLAKIIAVLICVAGSMHSGFAQDAANDPSALETEISNLIHATRHGDTPAQWQSLPSNAPEVMISMYSKSASTYEKLRLLGGLVWFPTDTKAVDFLKHEAQSNSNPTIRETAIRVLGKSQGIAEHDFLARELNSSNARIRVAAGLALSEIQDPKASSTVENFLSNEKNGWVVKKVKSHRAAHQKAIGLNRTATPLNTDPNHPLESNRATRPHKPVY